MSSPQPSAYRPLASPLPSHPGLSSTKSTHAVPTAHPAHPVSAGALSAISALLGASRARESAATPSRASPNGGLQRRSSLLARRKGDAGAAQFSLGPELGFSLPRARSKEGTQPDDDEIPPLEQGFRRSREQSRNDTLGDDLPPSPIGLPGGWKDGPTDTSGALLLPPPFLDDRSTAQSFEGLLGTRFARETSARARREARAYARDRPPPPAFPASLLATASKLVTALGPPGGVDSGPYYRRWKDDPSDTTPGTIKKERRRVERAEQGMKGFEYGQRIGRRLANRLRKERREHPDESQDSMEEREEAIIAEVRHELVAATPMSLFGASRSPLSPPLFSFETPGLTDTLSTTSPDAILPTPLDLAPPKPSLRPIFDDAEPSPLPLVPEEPPVKPGLDEGYFSTRQCRRPKPKLATSNLDTPHSAIKSLAPAPLTPTDRVISATVGTVQSQLRAHADLLIWILVGAPETGGGLDQGLASVGGLFGAILHLFGFVVFVLVHSWALVVSLALTLRSIMLFLHWVGLNLRGKTDLSIVVKEYLALCRKEWDKVCAEDGVRLGVWSVGLGLLELMAIQAVSKERWLADGPGNLILLNGDDPPADASVDSPGTPYIAPLLRRRSTKRRTSLEQRPGVNRGHSKRWTLNVEEGESLLVTGGGDSIMEGRILNDPFDSLSFTPSFSPREAPNEDDLEDLPPLDLNGTLPGFSFPPSPQSLTAEPTSPPLRPISESPTEVASDFTTLLRRHVRLATASYGLHSYILAPPSPLFTPGVNHQTLPHRVFTHLGGVDHKTSQVLHVAIQKHYTGVPAKPDADALEDIYEPQFYLLRDDLHGEVVCVVRGTQSLADIRTDLEAGMETVSLPSLRHDGGREDFLAHAGILAAAQRLLDPENSPLFAKLKASLEETGYSLVFNGHSLGAAIASTLAFLLGEYTPADPSISSSSFNAPICDKGSWTINSSCGLPFGRPVRAVCFAHPASVGLTLAHRCSLGIVPLVVSVSLGPDAVCRMGIPQVRELRRALGRLAKNRKRWLGERKKGEHGKSEILGAWWKWKGLGGADSAVVEGSKEGQSEKERERKEIEDKAWGWRCEMDGDGEVSSLMAIPAGKCFHVDRLPPDLEAARRKELEDELAARQADGGDDDEEETPVFGIYAVERPPPFYSIPFLEADLVKSHLPREYLDAINAL